MAWWKQFALALILIAGTAVIWARFVPAAGPILARLGLEAAQGAAPAPQRNAGHGGGGGGRGGALPVIGQPVGSGEANGRVSAIGDGRALHSVTVLPLAPGRLDEIAVASGDRVAKGAVIARLDRDSEAIALDRARLTVADAEETLQRTERLASGGTATEVQLSEARLALDEARLQVREAELALSRRDIVALIGGIVGLLPVDPGSQVDTASVVATLDDRSKILVDFRVPERFAGRISVGEPISATALARPDLPLTGRITALDSRVDAASRTLKVQAALDNDDDALRGGMAFAIDIGFAGDRFPSVDPLAIQWGSAGAYVWVGREGKAVEVPVRIVQRDSDQVLVAGALAPGETVVTEGVQRLRDGAPIAVAGDKPAEAGSGG